MSCYKPQATFVIFPDVSGVGMEAEELVNYLAEKHKVSIVPGGAKFFGPGSAGHVRICLATSREVLSEGRTGWKRASGRSSANNVPLYRPREKRKEETAPA